MARSWSSPENIEAARRRPRATTFFAPRHSAGRAPAAVGAADSAHSWPTPAAKSEARSLMDYGGVLRLRVDGQRRHAQSKSRGSQCDRELTHRLPPSVKRPKWS